MELDELFPYISAIALDGPKLVGKTTTATQRAADAVNLDRTRSWEFVSADPESILERSRPLLLDEWQKVPAVWDVVRRAVDEEHLGGQFLLTGSASPKLGATAHSGAGRIGRLRMRPMTLTERGITTPTASLQNLLASTEPGPLSGQTDFTLSAYIREITSSGFPPFRALGARARKFQLSSYLHNAVDRDVPEMGATVRKPAALLAWLQAYAAQTATTANYSAILERATPGEADPPSRVTANQYRDILTQLWLLDPVPAWSGRGFSLGRLNQSPKHHLADPALAVSLLNLDENQLMDGEEPSPAPLRGDMLGNLFESLATLCVRVAAQAAEADVYHLRTRNGDHEVDLILESPNGRYLAVEFKLGTVVHPRDVRHLHWLRERLGTKLQDALIINTGEGAYRRDDGIGVLPLALLGP